MAGVINLFRNIFCSKTSQDEQKRILIWLTLLKKTIETQLALSSLRSHRFLQKRTPSDNLGNNTPHVARSDYPADREQCFSRIYGVSEAIKRAIQDSCRYAGSGGSVLITGESGTGKELFAKGIHDASGRDGDFVAINCAAIPPGLSASELFGYSFGAFTGANKKGHTGKIEAANGGTLFLDEIGDMPPDLQVSFLRVLEEKKVMKLGGDKPIFVDFNLIAATNKDLYTLIEEGKFREDLFYRIETFQLSLPPLRERNEDILALAEKFLSDLSEKGRKSFTLSEKARKALLSYSWPGNVRELKNAMIFAATMSTGQVIKLSDLPKKFQTLSPSSNIGAGKNPYNLKPISHLERDVIKKALTLTGNNAQIAANILGLSKSTIYRKIKEHDL